MMLKKIFLFLLFLGTLLNAEELEKRFSPIPIAGLKRGMGCFLQGERLYAIGGGELAIYDVSKPSAPVLLSKLHGLGNVRQIVVRNKRAYIAAREHGIWIIDVSNGKHAKVISRFDTIELATGLDVAEPVIFVALRNYGIELVDVSDPTNPQHLANRKTSEAQSLRYAQGKLYVGNWAKCELDIFDVSDIRNPVKLSTTPLSGYGDGVEVRGNFCFAATGHHARTGKNRKGNGHGLDILDITNAEKPFSIARLRFPSFYHLSNDFWTVRLSGNTAIVADTHNGVFLCDIRNCNDPKIFGRILLQDAEYPRGKFPDAVSSIAVGNGVLYLTGTRTGLYVVEVPGLRYDNGNPEKVLISGAQKESPVPMNFYVYNSGSQIRGAAVQGDLAYLAAGAGGLHIVRLSANGIQLVGVHQIGHVYDVKIRGNRLYLAEGENGFAIYRIDKNCLTELGRYRMPQPWNDLAQLIWAPKDSSLVVVSSRGGLLRFFDVSMPSKIKKLLEHNQIGILYGDLACSELLEKRWFVNNWHVGGLVWYDCTFKTPVPFSVSKQVSSANDGIAVLNGKLLVLKKGKYALIDPCEKENPELWKFYTVAGQFLKGVPSVDGHVVALSHRADKTVRLFNFRFPESAQLLPNRDWKLEGHPGTVSFWRGKCVIPAGYQGLLLEK